jgi:cobalamin biosynthesis Mg chelatase CobN
MSALAAANPTNLTGQNLAKAEADLRTEATAIEKLRKQISESGSNASKESMAEFAKRQKAYLDRKIELEKHKRTAGEQPAVKTEKPEPAKVETAKKPEPAKAPEPTKPVAEKKPEPRKTEEPAKPSKPSEKSKPVEPAKPTVELKAPEKKSERAAEKPAVKTKTSTAERSPSKPTEPKPEISSSKSSSGGVSPLVWILLAATIAVVAWYFLGR